MENNTTDKLKLLLYKCKCSVSINVNKHRDYYISVQDRLKEIADNEWQPGIEPEVEAKMIETDTIVELQFYPDTPIGFYEIVHYDIDDALDMALATWEE